LGVGGWWVVGGGGGWVLAGVGDYGGCLGIKSRNGDDGAATEEKMCRGGAGVLYRYTEYGASSVLSLVGVASGWGMGAKCGRARAAGAGSAKAWKRGSVEAWVGWLGGGRRSVVGLDGEERRRGEGSEGSEGSEGRPWGSVLLATCSSLLATRYSLLAACCLAWAWFTTGLLWLCQDSRSVPIASRPASIQLRGPSKSRDGSGCGGKGPR